jgi:hypothetical protein
MKKFIVGCGLALSLLSFLYGHSILVDGDPSDWIGTPPSVDQWTVDQGEGIWTDAIGDDLGDGGDAPNASDNPSEYSYPDNPLYLGTEADITEFRVTDDFGERMIYFLIRLADFADPSYPMIVILADVDHITGWGQEWIPSYGDLRVSDENRWEYAFVIHYLIPAGEQTYSGVVDVYDQWWNMIPGNHVAYFNPDSDVIEIGVNAVFPIWGRDVYYTVLSGLQDSDPLSPEFGNFLEVAYNATSQSGGGGLDGWSDPDVYDLCFTPSSEQYLDLNNYTDDASAVIRSTTVQMFHHTDPPFKYTIDGDPSDWLGTPGGDDTWTLSEGEGIWRDSQDDDLGDGGDAPNASDNPDPYSYPTNAVFLGTEADIVEWRVADDLDIGYLYFLIKLNNFDTQWVPFISIMMDIIPGLGQTYVPHYADLLVSDTFAWDLAVNLWDGIVEVQNSDFSYFYGAHYVAFDTLNNTIEVAIDILPFTIPSRQGLTVTYAVVAGLQDGGNFREVDYNTQEWYPGGGVGLDGGSTQGNDWVDPDVFDLCFISASNQPSELNQYDDINGIPSTISAAYQTVEHPIVTYLCGDTNGDGFVNMADMSYLANYLFFGGPPPVSMWAADVNGDGTVNTADLSYLSNFLFFGGPPLNCP